MPSASAIGAALTDHGAHPFSLWIAGEDVITPVGSAQKGVSVDSIKVTEAGANTPGSMSFVMDDIAHAYSFPKAAEVIFWDHAQNLPIFGGFISARRKVPAFGDQGLAVQFDATGYDPLLDRQWITAFSYAAGYSDQALLLALVAQFGGKVNADSSSVASTNASMPAISLVGMTLRQGIESIADNAGAGRVYWIDSLKRLQYTSASALTAPYAIVETVGGAGDRVAEDLTVETEENVYTSVYVRGGTAAGTGWVRDYQAIADVGYDLQGSIDVPDSDTLTKRNVYGTSFLNRSGQVVTRGSFRIQGSDGWRPGQIVTITNSKLALTAATYQIAAVRTSFDGGTGLRTYEIEFGAISASLAKAIAASRGSVVTGDALTAALSAAAGTTVKTTALSIFDSAGVERVTLGSIGGGDYGLKVTAADGVTVVVDGTSEMFRIAASGTLTRAFAAAPSASTSTATIGAITGLTVSPAMLWEVTDDNSGFAQLRFPGLKPTFNSPAGTLAWLAGCYVSLSASPGSPVVGLVAQSVTANPGTTAAAKYYVLIQAGI